MGFYNVNEDLVVAKVNTILDYIEENGNPERICSCKQCRTDTICYILNRIKPHYIVSNRGAARFEQEQLKEQQKEADIIALVYEALRQVHHRMRPFLGHYTYMDTKQMVSYKPLYHIPIIKGRIFNGLNFAPMEEAVIELWYGKKLVPMVDNNWQNPYTVVSQTRGVFTFWPSPQPARGIDIYKRIGFSIKVVQAGFEALHHCFAVPVVSAIKPAGIPLERIFKLSDIYMFPPGEKRDELLPVYGCSSVLCNGM